MLVDDGVIAADAAELADHQLHAAHIEEHGAAHVERFHAYDFSVQPAASDAGHAPCDLDGMGKDGVELAAHLHRDFAPRRRP